MSETLDALPPEQLTLEELQTRESEIHAEILRRQELSRQQVLGETVRVMKAFGIELVDVAVAIGANEREIAAAKAAVLKSPNRKPGKKAERKYRDPASGQTWSGRGREPAWIKGLDRRAFLIPPNPVTDA
jgi:DNA-binding protein H-NS